MALTPTQTSELVPSTLLVDRSNFSLESEDRLGGVGSFEVEGREIKPLKSSNVALSNAETSFPHDSYRYSPNQCEPPLLINNTPPSIPIRAPAREIQHLLSRDPTIEGSGVISTQESTPKCFSSVPSRHLQPPDPTNNELRPPSVEYQTADELDPKTPCQKWLVSVNAADQESRFSGNSSAYFTENRLFQPHLSSTTSGVDAHTMLSHSGPTDDQSSSHTELSNFDSLFARQNEDEGFEDSDQRNEMAASWAGSMKTSAALKRGCLQIPCFIDDCCGKDNYISELMYGETSHCIRQKGSNG